MKNFELIDYRASHFLMRTLRSNLQGWYVRDNILLGANHPAGNRKDVTIISDLIDSATAWLNEIQPGSVPFILTDGTILKPELKKQVSNIFFNLFRQYLTMNQRLNEQLDNPKLLSRRREDFQYIVACMGWVYYEIYHSLHADLTFAEKFNDQELREARAGQQDDSQKEIDFVGYLVNTFHLDETYHEATCNDLIQMIESIMDTELRSNVQQIDRYLSALGK